ncbi:neuromedin-U receptor 2-like [Asterias amurensis]|uniref:neuromedin-U receptor 2-like n=1 Tax=Asterias amurensis TaxID=7602 RepID=UPI003AB391FE
MATADTTISESYQESMNSSFMENLERFLEEPLLQQYDKMEIVIVTLVMPCILILGLVTNLTFLYVVYRVSWMRTNVNAYLFHLAIADILFLVVGVGDKLWQYGRTPFLHDQMFRGTVGCVLVDLCADSAYFTGLFLVTLVSVHRFNAVCRPHSGTHQTRGTTKRWIASAWLLGILLSSSLIPSYCIMELQGLIDWPDVPLYRDFPEVIGMCKPIKEWMTYVANLVQTVPFFVAMTMNILLYVRIVMSLNHIVEKGSEYGCKDVNERIRNRVTKMLVANGCVFFFCLFPFELASLLLFTGSTIDVVWLHVFRTLLYTNSAVNPIIYGVTNSKYRQAVQVACSCWRRSRDLVRYELSIPLSRMKDNTAVTVANCRVRGDRDS